MIALCIIINFQFYEYRKVLRYICLNIAKNKKKIYNYN